MYVSSTVLDKITVLIIHNIKVKLRRAIFIHATYIQLFIGQDFAIYFTEFIVIETNTSDSAPCLPQGFLSPVAMSDVTSLYGAGLLIPNKAYLIGMFLPTGMLCTDATAATQKSYHKRTFTTYHLM